MAEHILQPGSTYLLDMGSPQADDSPRIKEDELDTAGSRGIPGLTLRNLHGNPRAALLQALLLVVIIALVDWRVDLNLAFGFLYLFPMLLVGTALNRWQVVLAALF